MPVPAEMGFRVEHISPEAIDRVEHDDGRHTNFLRGRRMAGIINYTCNACS
jgi:hypothetical protein